MRKLIGALMSLLLIGLSGVTTYVAAAAKDKDSEATPCNGTLLPGEYKDVIVPVNGTCFLTSVQVVDHNIYLDSNAYLFAYGTQVGHDIESIAPTAYIETRFGTSVGHDISFKGPGGGVTICSTTVGHDVTVEQAINFDAQVGGVDDGGIGGGCGPNGGNDIGHNLIVRDSTAAVETSNNNVGHNLELLDNHGSGGVPSGAHTVLNNQIDHALICLDNNPPPVSAGNTAQKYEGQCQA
ncbi:MAG TPA: hypothetical protein VHK65_09760 [Candidatus Dormibacteraeota bacterium]|nr:hypothetical protein [Candidatus Dormibacteraeota bacterium]